MKKSIPKLPVSELQIMIILWEGHPEMSRLEIAQALEGNKKLAPTTINTLLFRLEGKKFISVTKKGRTNYYTPLVSKKDYQRRESHLIIDTLFGGSLVNFVTALYDDKKISAEKKEELELFLESLDQEQEDEESCT